MAKKFLFRCDNVTLIYDNLVFKLYAVYRDSYLLEQNVVWKLLERMTRRGQKTSNNKTNYLLKILRTNIFLKDPPNVGQAPNEAPSFFHLF